MTTRRSADFDLRRAVLDPGFTPRARDAEALVELLAAGGELAAPAETALLRLGPAAHEAAIAHAAGRPAVVRLLGRLGTAEEDPAITAALVAALSADDPRVRRAAATALGKARPAEAGEALAGASRREASASARRAVIAALGKVGGEEARAAIAVEEERADPEVARERERAALMIDRTASRAEPSRLDASRPAGDPVRVSLHCRAGLERILAEELAPQVRARVVREEAGGVHLEAPLQGAPADLLAARTLLSIGFPLDPVAVEGPEDEAIVAALTSPQALGILRRWTVGPIRYRIAFRTGGKHRATVWRVAAEVARRVPELVNDPTGSPWEAVVDIGPGRVAVELVPDLPDPRFAYRTGDVPAASHPTIAAALVRVAGVREDDVVWDPFVGSGTELCERALAGPYRVLSGSDLDPAALAVARANLVAAGVPEPSLFEGDATSAAPPGPAPTLIVTNPPLGRRVQRTALLAPMLERFLAHAARVLAPEGRISWISPFPERTRLAAERAGLFLSRAVEVDLGGFAVEMQLFRALPAARRRR